MSRKLARPGPCHGWSATHSFFVCVFSHLFSFLFLLLLLSPFTNYYTPGLRCLSQTQNGLVGHRAFMPWSWVAHWRFNNQPDPLFPDADIDGQVLFCILIMGHYARWSYFVFHFFLVDDVGAMISGNSKEHASRRGSLVPSTHQSFDTAATPLKTSYLTAITKLHAPNFHINAMPHV